MNKIDIIILADGGSINVLSFVGFFSELLREFTKKIHVRDWTFEDFKYTLKL